MSQECNINLQKEWLETHVPKQLKTIYYVETPMLDMIENKKSLGCTSGRTLYQRRFIEEVRGKPCSMCTTPLKGDNTWIIYKIYPRKYKEEVYCTCCAVLPYDKKAEIRKIGWEQYQLVATIRTKLERFKEFKKELKDFIGEQIVKRADTYYNKQSFTDAINMARDKIAKIDLKVKELEKQIKTIYKDNSYEEDTRIEIDYNEIVPFRSEEDFDF